jgi:hypothetical protein
LPASIEREAAMSSRNFSALAAVIFAIVAALHVIRAVAGWPVTIDAMSVPIWASWVACLATGALAWLGFAASRA